MVPIATACQEAGAVQQRVGIIGKTSAGLGCLAELVEAANEGVMDTERSWMGFLFFWCR